jgi:hypothetical protein
MKVLAIEDSDPKWERVESVIRRCLGEVEITRAKDLHDGERLVEEPGWNLLILDISLDIRAGGGRGGRGAHDYTGGLKIAGRMYYQECEVPTIIVTGFDAFPTGAATHQNDVILGMEDVNREAGKLLRDHLLGSVRFGSGDWEDQLAALLAKVERS